jgi:hypothetical protein
MPHRSKLRGSPRRSILPKQVIRRCAHSRQGAPKLRNGARVVRGSAPQLRSNRAAFRFEAARVHGRTIADEVRVRLEQSFRFRDAA